VNRNQRLSAARAWAHDRICRSDTCGSGDNDHARRTQNQWARRAIEATTRDDLRYAVHDAYCLERWDCRDRDEHIRAIPQQALDREAHNLALAIGYQERTP
jgi:hypothetical protein